MRTRLNSLLLVVAVAASVADAKTPEPITGKVVKIADGDTLTVPDNGDHLQHRIRLAGIDAPEKKQPFGTRAREALASKVFGKEIFVDVVSLDRYGRDVG